MLPLRCCWRLSSPSPAARRASPGKATGNGGDQMPTGERRRRLLRGARGLGVARPERRGRPGRRGGRPCRGLGRHPGAVFEQTISRVDLFRRRRRRARGRLPREHQRAGPAGRAARRRRAREPSSPRSAPSVLDGQPTSDTGAGDAAVVEYTRPSGTGRSRGVIPRDMGDEIVTVTVSAPDRASGRRDRRDDRRDRAEPPDPSAPRDGGALEWPDLSQPRSQ